MDCKFCEIDKELMIMMQFSESTWFTDKHSISNSDSVPDHQIFVPSQQPRSNAVKNERYADGYLMMMMGCRNESFATFRSSIFPKSVKRRLSFELW